MKKGPSGKAPIEIQCLTQTLRTIQLKRTQMPHAPKALYSCLKAQSRGKHGWPTAREPMLTPQCLQF